MWIGLDDTDVLGSPGTNQLARQIAQALPQFGMMAHVVLRHQLLMDPRVPCTTQNGSASLIIHGWSENRDLGEFWDWLSQKILAFAPAGSDPALALTTNAPGPKLARFGRWCKHKWVDPKDALDLAARENIRLAQLAGRDHGLVGALAAVGLAGSGADGRVVHRHGWPWPDHFDRKKTAQEVLARGIDGIFCTATNSFVHRGDIHIKKRPRPAWREGKVILLVVPNSKESHYDSIKAP